jgi:ActR/RegA family two-component response regulator
MTGILGRLLIINDQRDFACQLSAVAERLRFAARTLPHVLDLDYLVQHWRPEIIVVHMGMADNQDVEALEYLERIGFAGRLLLTGDVGQSALEKAATVARTHGLAVSSVLTKRASMDQVQSAFKQLLGLERAA